MGVTLTRGNLQYLAPQGKRGNRRYLAPREEKRKKLPLALEMRNEQGFISACMLVIAYSI